jgi:uncharacterized integral membrane protein (TIGR00698 family)
MTATSDNTSAPRWRQVFFLLALAACFTPAISPPLALALGLGVGLFLGHPWLPYNGKVIKPLLQGSVVLLGFGMNLAAVYTVGKQGVTMTLCSLAGTMTLGWLLGKALRVDPTTALLVSSGTAICGGSAIAAVGPVLQADERQMSMSLGTVFVLNALAIFIFPPLGNWLELSQEQFGQWAAVAIHDTSSVVGAAAKYGAEALQVGTTVKLVRTLWIIPLVLVLSLVRKQKASRLAIPWFVVGFLLAAAARSGLPQYETFFGWLLMAGKRGLTITLFLIGTGISLPALRHVGVRPFVLGVLLWAVVAGVSLAAVMG